MCGREETRNILYFARPIPYATVTQGYIQDFLLGVGEPLVDVRFSIGGISRTRKFQREESSYLISVD